MNILDFLPVEMVDNVKNIANHFEKMNKKLTEIEQKLDKVLEQNERKN